MLFMSAVPLCVDLSCTPQDQLLSQREEIGSVALGIFFPADVGVVAGRGQQRCGELDARHDLHAACLDRSYRRHALPHLVVVLLGEGRDQQLGDLGVPALGLVRSAEAA